MKKFIFIFLALYLFLLIVGLSSEPSLGDEVYHYRFAENFFWQGKRPIVDILYLDAKQSEIIYYYDIFWHGTLALIWKIIGHISLVAAQIYHSFYYILLIFFTYLLGKELYGKEAGLYSAFFVATVPMMSVFSILFYTDVPTVVFSVLCVLLVLKKRCFWAGVALGLMYLCKRNALLLAPSILFICFYQDGFPAKKKLVKLLFFIMGAAIVISPDTLWREAHFKGAPPNMFTKPQSILIQAMHQFKKIPVVKVKIEATGTKVKMAPVATVEVGDVKTFTNMINKDVPFTKYAGRFLWFSYFGFGILMGLISYFLQKQWQKKDLIPWSLVGSYLLLYLFFLRFSNEVRYLMPTVPFLCILAAVSLVASEKKILTNLIVVLCIFQFVVSICYLGGKRKIPKQINEGFAFVERNTPKESKVFYIEHLALNKTNRKIKLPMPGDPLLQQMFWSSDDNGVLDAIEQMGIDYIMVKKSRIYDDTTLSYFNGYPKSFIDKLPYFSFVQLVFDNNEASVWKIKKY